MQTLQGKKSRQSEKPSQSISPESNLDIQQVNRQLDELDLAEAILTAQEDPYFYLTTFCYTLDPHDAEHPIKLIPKKPYIKYLCKEFLNNSLLLVEKSRQMIVTWTFVALALWDAQFHSGRLTFFQSKKEDDANVLVERAKFIYAHQIQILKDRYPTKKPAVYMKLEFPQTNSVIRATPQGGDQIRMHTASLIFSDEFAFQEQAKQAYSAAKPTIDGGGKFVAVSSVNGKNFFYRLGHDLEGTWESKED